MKIKIFKKNLAKTAKKIYKDLKSENFNCSETYEVGRDAFKWLRWQSGTWKLEKELEELYHTSTNKYAYVTVCAESDDYGDKVIYVELKIINNKNI